MAALTICSDFGAPKNKVWHCFHCFPIYFPWSDGTRCHDLNTLHHIWKTPSESEMWGGQKAHSGATVMTPKITQGKRNQSKQKSHFQHSPHMKNLSSFHLFSFHSTSYIHYAPNPGEIKWRTKQTQTILNFLMTSSHRIPSSTQDTYRCQPAEQWFQPQAKVYSWRIFQSTWSSWKPNRNTP